MALAEPLPETAGLRWPTPRPAGRSPSISTPSRRTGGRWRANCSPSNAPPWSRPMPMGSASSRSPQSSPRPAARPFSWPILPKRAACAPAPRDATIYVLNGFSPRGGDGVRRTQRAAGHQQHDRACRVGRLRRRPNWQGGAALHVDTGMNRLGISADEAAALAPRVQTRKPRHHAADEPPRLRRNRRSPAQRQPDPAVSRAAPALSRRSRFAGQFLRHLPWRRRRISTWRGPAPRSTASIRRPDAPIPCATWSN